MRIKIIFIPLMFLVACSGGGEGGVMDQIMDSWKGATLDEAISKWGYPDGERKIAGRSLYQWDRDVTVVLPATTSGTVTTFGNTSYLNGTTTGGVMNGSCRRILEVDNANVIVGTQWSGNNCPFAEMGPYANWRR